MRKTTQIAISAAFIILLHVLPPCGGAGGAFAQITWPENYTKPGWVYQGLRGRDYLIPKVAADSASLPTYPLLWTNGTRRDSSRGALAWTIAENKLWKWNGTAWSSVGGTGGGSSTDTTSLSNRINLKLNIADTANMLLPYRHWTQGYLKAADIAGKLNISDTATMLAPYALTSEVPAQFNPIAGANIGITGTYPNITFSGTVTQYTDALARAAISLTTTGTSGAATYNSSTGVFNIPQYSGGGGVTTVGAFQSGSTANGASISGSNIFMHKVSATNPGMLSTGTDTIAGAKTFSSAPTFSSMTAGRIPYFGTGGLVSNSANLTWDNTNTSLILNKTALVPDPSLIFTGATINAFGTTSSDFQFHVATASDFRPTFFGSRSRGTLTVPTATSNGDRLFSVVGGGYDGTNLQYPASIDFVQDAAASAGNVPASINFLTGNNASGRASRLTINSSGVVTAKNQLVALGSSGAPSGTIPNAINYTITAANNAIGSWVHIINNAGAAQGAFFGMSSSNFEQYNWQGGPIIFYTNASVSAGTRRFAIENSGRISIGASNANASAILDVQSTAAGFLPPRMTTAQRNLIASPATGLQIFCTDCTATDGSTGVSQTYSSSTWKNHY